MNPRRWIPRSALALAVAAPMAVRPVTSAAVESVVASTEDIVAVEDVQSDGVSVSGRLVNRTDARLEDVELLLSDTFVWKDGRHPGDDDPGRAVDSVIPGPIPPHTSVPFRFARMLPPRSDGAFLTHVDVVRLNMYTDAPRVSAVW